MRHALALALTLSGCAAQHALRAPEAQPARSDAPAAALASDPFLRDHAPGGLSEEDLARLLATPAVLEEHARIGVLPVRGPYDPDRDVPLSPVTGALAEALEQSGHFDFVTEISTDWPSTGSIAGLRELAARNRCRYLLLSRHRFVDRSWTNPWAWSWITVVGLFAAPAATVETAGLVEATLFDVRTGTLLFTEYERVHGEAWSHHLTADRHEAGLRGRLLAGAAAPLAERVVAGVRQLVAARERRPKEALADASAAR